MKALKVAGGVLVAGLLVVTAVISAFWPGPELRQRVVTAPSVPAMLGQAIDASFGRPGGIYDEAARRLHRDLDRRSRMLTWLAHIFATETWLFTLVPRAQVIAFVADDAHYGRGVTGAEAAADAYFCKPLAALTEREAVALAALTLSPSRYGTDADALLARADQLIGLMEISGVISPDDALRMRTERAEFCDET